MTSEGYPEGVPQPATARRVGLVAIVAAVLALPLLLLDFVPAATPSEPMVQAAPAGAAGADHVATTAGPSTTSTLLRATPGTRLPAATATTAAPSTTTSAAPTTTTPAVSSTSSTAPKRSLAPAPTTTAAPSTTIAPTTTATTAAPTTTAPPTTVGGDADERAVLACIRARESGGNYSAVNPAGYYGAYQFAPSTWNGAASHAGRVDLVGVRPDRVAPADQDFVALHLLRWQGLAPWGGACG